MDYDDDAMIDKLLEHKKVNSDLKLLLSVGGWSNGSAAFSNMVSSEESRKEFINTSIEYLKRRGFEGIDISWKYPADREGSRPEDKHNLTLLLKELKRACEQHNLILTAAISASKYYIEKSYEIAEIAKYLDWINFMTYDFYGNWQNIVGFNTPMYSRNEESDENQDSNVDSAVKYIIVKGVPREKIYLGLATYGRSFTLENENNRRPGDRALRGGHPGEFTDEEGLLSFYEIRNNIKKNSWTEVFDIEQKVPYAYKGDQWVGFDNIQSIKIKAKYILDQKLGGAHVWTLDFDDFKGSTSDYSRFPLITAAKSILKGLPERHEIIEKSRKYDVFVSYCWAQNEIVDNLLYILEKENFKCWTNKSYVLPGALSNKILIDAILNSTIIIACVSKEYMENDIHSKELIFANENGKRIVPIMFSNDEFSTFIKDFKETEVAFHLKSAKFETQLFSCLTEPDIRNSYTSNPIIVKFIETLKAEK